MDADVIVAGAGVAGLAAARALASHSLRVIVVEARDRVGGRVWSRRLDGVGVPVELGAEFVHGSAPETRALLRDSGGEALPTVEESWSYEDGALEREDQSDFARTLEMFSGVRDLPDDVSVDEYLRRFEHDPSKRKQAKTARAFVEGFDAADPAIASARGIADEWESGADSESARPSAGYAPIVARLHDDCVTRGVSVLLSHTVRAIDWRRRDVSVRTDAQTLRAPAAIVTLPVSLLQRENEGHVRFDPGLPPAKSGALEKIVMGHVVKAEIAFHTPFWEQLLGGRYRDSAYFRDSNGPFGVYWTQLPLRRPYVVAWAGGPKAVLLQGMPEAEVIALAVRTFGSLFGEADTATRAFAGGTLHDWAADPFSLGAYSYLAVGGSDARATLAQPLDDTLFFAGEATSLDGQGGTVNGAIQTGERAAKEVLACRI